MYFPLKVELMEVSLVSANITGKKINKENNALPVKNAQLQKKINQILAQKLKTESTITTFKSNMCHLTKDNFTLQLENEIISK